MLVPRRGLALLALLAALTGGCDDHDEKAPAGVSSERLAPMPAPPRTEVVGAYWDGQVAVLTGLLKDGSASAAVDFYDPQKDSWSPGPPLPRALHHTGVGVLGGRLYAVGGYEATSEGWKPVAEVHSLGRGEQAWRPEPPLAGPRGALAVASTGSALVAVGGTGPGPGDALVRTEILAAGATRWEAGPDLHGGREHLAATAAHGRVYAIGGRLGSLEGNLASVESFQVGDGAWREEPSLQEARGGIGATTLGQSPCVAGGEAPGGRTIAPIECLVDGRWQVVASLQVPRHGLAVVAVGRALHIIGGGPQPGLTVSDAHERFDWRDRDLVSLGPAQG